MSLIESDFGLGTMGGKLMDWLKEHWDKKLTNQQRKILQHVKNCGKVEIIKSFQSNERSTIFPRLDLLYKTLHADINKLIQNNFISTKIPTIIDSVQRKETFIITEEGDNYLRVFIS